jgi:4a-hydroxytetrahydrobiopterin dehydratase
MTPKHEKLDAADIAARTSKLAGWTYLDGKLRREYRFADFVQAFSFMTGAALVAESMNHHPDWSNVWNKVKIELSTHDAGGVTKADFALAEKMEAAAQTLLRAQAQKGGG